MDNSSFINNIIDKINIIRAEEFKKFNYTYDEKIIEKKLINENLKEFKDMKQSIKKRASIDKMKPSNIHKKEYDNININIDILEDDIFNNNEDTSSDVKLNIELLNREQKIDLINEFIQRKNIIFEPTEYIKIEGIVDNPEITLKKYINISKLYQQVTKISFIKKLENGSYIIDLSESKAKKSKKYFI